MPGQFDFRRFESLYPSWEARFASGPGTGRFGYRPGYATCSYGSTDMLFCRAIQSRLELSREETREWAEVINGFQDGRGWYRKSHTIHHREHTTAYAIAALSLLGAKPRHRLAWADPIQRDERSMERWIRGPWWSLAWPGSHVVGGVAAALAMTGEGDSRFFEWYFRWLDGEADPDSGYWSRGLAHRLGLVRKDGMHAMGGSFHMYFLYERFGLKWPHPEKVVDATLALQHANGFWDGRVAYCVDLDGVWCLTRSSRIAGGHRADEVREACARFLAGAERTLNDREFLFSNYRDSHRLPGALAAIAECQLHYPEMVLTERPWRQTLDSACWI